MREAVRVLKQIANGSFQKDQMDMSDALLESRVLLESLRFCLSPEVSASQLKSVIGFVCVDLSLDPLYCSAFSRDEKSRFVNEMCSLISVANNRHCSDPSVGDSVFRLWNVLTTPYYGEDYAELEVQEREFCDVILRHGVEYIARNQDELACDILSDTFGHLDCEKVRFHLRGRLGEFDFPDTAGGRSIQEYL